MLIWEQENWSNFTWDEKIIEPKLRDIRFHQGMLLGRMSSQPKDQKQSMLDTLLANIIHSSAIEGERLNAFSVRLSMANRLGLSEKKPFTTTERTNGLAEIMIDAVQNLDAKLSLERI